MRQILIFGLLLTSSFPAYANKSEKALNLLHELESLNIRGFEPSERIEFPQASLGGYLEGMDKLSRIGDLVQEIEKSGDKIPRLLYVPLNLLPSVLLFARKETAPYYFAAACLVGRTAIIKLLYSTRELQVNAGNSNLDPLDDPDTKIIYQMTLKAIIEAAKKGVELFANKASQLSEEHQIEALHSAMAASYLAESAVDAFIDLLAVDPDFVQQSQATFNRIRNLGLSQAELAARQYLEFVDHPASFLDAFRKPEIPTELSSDRENYIAGVFKIYAAWNYLRATRLADLGKKGSGRHSFSEAKALLEDLESNYVPKFGFGNNFDSLMHPIRYQVKVGFEGNYELWHRPMMEASMKASSSKK